MKILIKKGTVVNHDGAFAADVLVSGGRIVKVGDNIKESVDKEIDAQGKFIMPGFIDLHVHLRKPGREDEEDFESGSKAAAKGGFTTIFTMPNTTPCIDSEGLAKWVVEEGQKIKIADIRPVGAITREREGKELTEFAALKRAGCLSLSDDGLSIDDASLLKRALEYAKMVDILITSHCEDKNLSCGGAMRESVVSSKYGIGPIPAISESICVHRDIDLAKYVNARLHLAHISCAESVAIIRHAKETFPLLSCETAPHYFILNVDDVEKSRFNANFKVNPPLGSKEDVEAIKKALKDGVIDCIATDHAPHSAAEKEIPFEDAPFGFIGLELAFSLSYTYLVRGDILSLSGLVEKLSFNPAKIVAINDRGQIKEGLLADIVIVDLEKKWQVQEESFVSKSKNTPFLGYTIDGLVDYTIYRGEIVFERRQEKD
ncbi:MAG: dihydroorotase [Candidatus Omnitrophota bacterium]